MNKRLSINEVAKIFNISSDAIRLYEKEGMVSPIRDESNGYRYFEHTHIHRIMGINLYRQLNLSINDIKRIGQISEFPEMINEFDLMIEETKNQILQLEIDLQKKIFMANHLKYIHENLNTYTIKALPKKYVVYENNEITKENFGKAIDNCVSTISHSELYSYGNFGQKLSFRDNIFSIDSLFYLIDDSFLSSCPLKIDKASLQTLEYKKCLFTVIEIPENELFNLKLEDINIYLNENMLVPKDQIYAFYIYSLNSDECVKDYYEIYIPLE